MLQRGPGAVIDASVEALQSDALVDAWRLHLAQAQREVSWAGAAFDRRFAGGVSLSFEAPEDCLYAACEVNEWAFAAAVAEVCGEAVPPMPAEALHKAIEDERNPAWIALAQAARARGLRFIAGDDLVSVGSGTGALSFPEQEIPAPEAIDWDQVHDVPAVLITGTNGKTTTVRLLAAMAREAGHVAGNTSTDGVVIDGVVVEPGDYTGPGGARTVLRDRRVSVALLETARGGILRRGLVLDRAEAALVTNVAADHLGEYGILDLAGMVDTKMVITSVVEAGGCVALCWDDESLRRAGRALGREVQWYGLADSDEIRVGRNVLGDVSEFPIAVGGAALHNLRNALGAWAVGAHLGFAPEAMLRALRSFGARTEDNPGRANRYRWQGVDVLVDFAHNPHGVVAILEMAQQMPAHRRIVMIGQAGDRDDASIIELAEAIWDGGVDHVIVKELPGHLRGRPLGEIPALIERVLRERGAPESAITHAPDEPTALAMGLEMAEAGDLLLALSHEAREAVIAEIEARGAEPA